MVNRFVTAHDSQGRAIFVDVPPVPVSYENVPFGELQLLYTTSGVPVNPADDKDIQAYIAQIPSSRSRLPTALGWRWSA